MIFQTTYNGQNFECDLSKPLDISIPVGQVKCFYSTDFKISPYVSGDFIGAVKKGAPVNFFDVQLNPHGNGTHTECLGHITEKQEFINDQLKQFHFITQLISVPFEEKKNGDKVITKENLIAACPKDFPNALVIRTVPNYKRKLTKDYSGTNPPYLDKNAMKWLVKKNVKHLLLDLPSVDREVDKGKLLAHHIFWNVENKAAKDNSRKDCTITELIFVPSEIKDGLYLLNIQIPSFPLDAAPSKPVLYKLNKLNQNVD